MSETIVNKGPDEAPMLQAHDDPIVAARELAHELKTIDWKLRDVEAEMSRQTDEAAVHELITKRDAIARRKEALPFLIRGARHRYLNAQTEAWKDRTAEAEVAFNAATEEEQKAKQRFDAAAAALEVASDALKAAERKREQSERHYSSCSSQYATFSIDALRIQKGEELLVPGRFDEAQ